MYRLGIAALLIFMINPAVSWAIDFQPVSPEELKMTSYSRAPGAPAILLFRQVDRDDSGSGTHEDNYVRVKILTEEGKKYANVEIPYWKGDLKITGLHARTIRPDGTIVNFEGKPFEKTVIKTRGVKLLTETFTIPDVSVGCILEYSYRIEFGAFFVFDSHWIVADELFTKSARFTLKPSNSFVLRVHANHLPQDIRPVQDESRNSSRCDRHSGLSGGRLHASGERIESAR